MYGNLTVVTELYKDGGLVARNVYTIDHDPTTTFSGFILVLFLAFIIVVPLMFITSTIGVVIGVIVSIIMAIALTFASGGSIIGIGSAVIWLIVAGGIIIWKITQIEG